jgi:hypothetical protein
MTEHARIIITSDYLDSVVSLLEGTGLMTKSQIATYDKQMFPACVSLPYTEERKEEIHTVLREFLGKVGYTSFSISVAEGGDNRP